MKKMMLLFILCAVLLSGCGSGSSEIMQTIPVDSSAFASMGYETACDELVQMIPVDSSAFASVGYEDGTLYICFHNGSLYSYTDVPASVYDDLMSASSKGSYFHAHIRDQYDYNLIG